MDKIQSSNKEKLANKIIDLTVSGIYIYDLVAENNVYINPHYTKVLGYRLEDLNAMDGEAFFELFHPEDQPRISAHMDEILRARDDDILEIEYRFRTVRGDWVWCLSRDMVFQRDEEGNVQQFIGTFLDITKRKQTEETLQENEKRFRTIVQNLPLGAGYIEGETLFLNDATEQITGYRPSDLKTLDDWFRKMYGKDHVAVREYYEQDLKAGFPVPRTVSLRRKDGMPRIVEFQGYRFSGGNLWVFQDITERRQAEEKLTAYRAHLEDTVRERTAELEEVNATLRDSEEHFRKFIEGTDDLVTQVDGQGRFIYVNHTAEEVFGIPPEECIGQSAFAFIDKRDQERTERWFSDCLQNKVDSAAIENRQVSRTGDVRGMSWRVNFHYDHKGDLRHVNSIARDITEQKQAERALVESKQKLLKAEKVARMGFLEWDFKTDDIELSDEIIRLYGLDPEKRWITPEFTATIVHPDDLELVKRSLDLAVRGEKKHDLDHRIIRPDGDVIWVHAQADLVYEDDGKPIGLLGTAVDITDRKRAEEKLWESERKYRQQSKVLNAINRVFQEALTCESEREVADTCLSMAEELTGSKFGLIGEKNSEGRFDTIAISNPGWDACKMPDSDATRLIKDMEIRGIDRSTIREKKSRIVNDPASHPDRVGTPEGHPPITSFLGVPLKHANKTIGMIGLGNKESGYDLSDQQAIEDLSVAFMEALMGKRTEEALQESEKRYRTVADFTYDWESWIDPDGKYIYVSPSCERITGYSAEEFMEDPGLFTRIVHPDDRESVSAHVEGHLKGAGDNHIDFRVISRGDDVRWISHNCQPVYDQDRNWLGIRASNRDITDRMKLSDQLVQSQKMEAMGTLAGGIAHDFNNILAAIMGYSELAKTRIPEDSEVIIDLNEVLKAANRAKALVRQILTVSRRHKQERKPIQIKYVVKDALSLLRATFPTTIEIRQDLAKDTGIVDADPTQMHQVIMNIGTNAGQAMEKEGGLLTIVLDNVELDDVEAAPYLDMAPGPYLRLTVSDTGNGMSPEIIEQIFDPYFTTKEIGEGTGLGLSVAHGIIKSHGGTIRVYSQSGEGSTFHVYLPVIKRLEKPQKEAEGPVPKGNERVLFIDDERAIVDIGRQMLEGLGYDVVSTRSSIEALELFRAEPDRFDLIITDMSMPHMTGDKLTQELIKIRPQIPIILCTGHSKQVSEEKAKEIGIRAFLMKPISTRAMAEAIREVLDEK